MDRPPNPVFFLDKCLGKRVVASALKDAGQAVELHSDHFPGDAADSDWIPVVGKQGWVILTKDRSIKSNQIEIMSLLAANTHCFNLVSAEMTGPQMGTAFVTALDQMIGIVSKTPPPIIGNVTKSGNVTGLLNYTDLLTKLTPPPSSSDFDSGAI